MPRTRERGQPWRCFIPGCPTKGQWQFEPPGRPHLLPPHPESHYMRIHWVGPARGERHAR